MEVSTVQQGGAGGDLKCLFQVYTSNYLSRMSVFRHKVLVIIQVTLLNKIINNQIIVCMRAQQCAEGKKRPEVGGDRPFPVQTVSLSHARPHYYIRIVNVVLYTRRPFVAFPRRIGAVSRTEFVIADRSNDEKRHADIVVPKPVFGSRSIDAERTTLHARLWPLRTTTQSQRFQTRACDVHWLHALYLHILPPAHTRRHRKIARIATESVRDTHSQPVTKRILFERQNPNVRQSNTTNTRCWLDSRTSPKWVTEFNYETT